MRGIKKVAGMTQRYCEKDGYGMRVQGVYNPAKDEIRPLLQFGGSYFVPAEGEISVWFSTPTTMDGVVDAVYDRLDEIRFMEQYIKEELGE